MENFWRLEETKKEFQSALGLKQGHAEMPEAVSVTSLQLWGFKFSHP